MKKIIIMFGLVLLSSCANEWKTFEEELSQEREVVGTLETFDTLFYYEFDDTGCWRPKNMNVEAKLFTDPDINIDCVYYKGGDECIVYNRSVRNSKVCYFNYKKYLPENSVIETDADFLKLYRFYKWDDAGYKDCVNDCKNSYDSTMEEKKQCAEKCETKLIAFATGGLSVQKKNQQQAQIKAAQKAAEQKAKNAADKADCEQAKEKAKNREKEIKIALGLDPNGYLASLSGKKVADFANDGVFVDNDCEHRIVCFGGWCDERCKSSLKFVYTSDTDYAANASFKNKGLIYIESGNYKYKTITGATNSVPAYKATQYKTSEIDYETYLENKELKCK